MSTYNIQIAVAVWTKIADVSDTDFLVTWAASRIIEFASTEVDSVPLVTGHRLSKENRVTREEIGAGHVWAKVVPGSSLSKSQIITISKTTSVAGAVGGFDGVEGVHKVAMMVWNPTSLQWERSTGVSGGESGGGATIITTKRIDVVSDLLIYIGEAAVGTAESSTGWAIKKITFDGSGNPTAELHGSGSWVNRAAVSYQ